MSPENNKAFINPHNSERRLYSCSYSEHFHWIRSESNHPIFKHFLLVLYCFGWHQRRDLY